MALVAMVIMPNVAWAQFPVKIGDIQLTDENIDTFGGSAGSVSYSDGTLTLNNATLTGAICVTWDNNEPFTIKLEGSNSITISTDGPCIYTTNSTSTPDLSFEKDWGLDCDLTLQNGGNEDLISGFGTIVYNENDFRQVDDATNHKTSFEAIWFMLGGISVSKSNAASITHDGYISGTVSFNKSNNTLTLDNATVSDQTLEWMLDEDLTVNLIGANTFNCNDSYAFDCESGTLTFTTSSTSPGSLTMNNPEDPYSGGFTVEFADGSGLSESRLIVGNDTSPMVVGVHYGKVGDRLISNANASDVLGDGSEKVTFAPSTATLTLNNFADDCNITSGLDNLNVALVGSNSVGNIVYGGTSTTSSISFSGTGSLTFDATSVPYGFTNVAYGDDLAMKVTSAEAHIITQLEAPVLWPTLSMGQRVIEIRNYFTDATVTYSLTYANTSLATENKTDQTYTESFVLKGPATITTKATIGSKVSAVATAYYFGAETNPMTFAYGDSFTAPTLVPNVEGVSILSGSYEEDISLDGVATVNEGRTSFTLNGIGKGLAYARVNYPEQSNYTVVNDTLGFYIEVVPTEPIIAFDNTKTYLNTDNIEISIDGTYATYAANNNITNTIYYSWDENPTTGTVYQEGGVAARAQTGTKTLTAWVSSTKSGNTYSSEKTSQAFTIKTDISDNTDYTVTGLSATAPYTGTAVNPGTPTITDPKGTPLTKDTDYTVIYKKKLEGDGYETVESMTDVGNYLIVIAGTGSFGGSQEFNFEITQGYPDWNATGWTSPEAKADLTFTNEAKDLITGATVPDGVTVKYCYKYSTSEFNEEALSALPDPANWTTTVPQGTNVGYYAVFYKVEESANYEGWGPCEVALQVPIAKGTISTVTVNITGWEFGGYDASKNSPSVTEASNPGGGEVTYQYKENKDGTTFSSDLPENVGNYIVQATVPETDNYLGNSGTATFSITAKSITVDMITLSATSLEYNGESQTPAVTVKDGETNLTGDDYEVSYKQGETDIVEADIVNVNTYTVVVTGKGNYTGSATKTFEITPKSIADADVTVGGTYTYTGAAITPAAANITVKDGTTTLTTDDYTISYENNINAGTNTAKVIVTGKGNYDRGTSANGTFTIGQMDIANAVITLDNTELTYNGEQQTVNVTKVMVGDIEVPVDCYEVSGNTEREVGDYTLTVTAKQQNSDGSDFNNNFTGSAEKTWKIKKRTVTVDELGLSDDQTSCTYYNSTEDLELPENIVVYIITGVSGSSVTTQRISYIPKGVAVYVESGSSTQTVNDEIPAQLPLKGAATATNVSDITGGTVYVLYKGLFVRTTTGTIPANRCYLVVSGGAGARVLTINHGDGDSVGIESVTLSEGEGVWYDLRGRRIEKPTKKGIYILNGEKVVVNSK